MHVHDEDEASTGIHSGSLNESGSETVSGLDDAGKTKGSDGSEACIPSEVSSSQPLSAGESGETDNVVDFGSLDPGQADPSGQGAASSDDNQEPPNSSDNPSGDAPSGEQWTCLLYTSGPFCHAGSGCTGTGDSPRVASGLAGVGRNMPENALAGT